jgi:hypothetical protein
VPVESAAVRNGPALLGLLVALLALGVLAGAGYAARELIDISWLEAAAAVPVACLLALLALSLASRGRSRHQATLGRAGGAGVVRVTRGLGFFTLLLSLTAGLALAVFGVLVWTDGLQRAPW